MGSLKSGEFSLIWILEVVSSIPAFDEHCRGYHKSLFKNAKKSNLCYSSLSNLSHRQEIENKTDHHT